MGWICFGTVDNTFLSINVLKTGPANGGYFRSWGFQEAKRFSFQLGYM